MSNVDDNVSGNLGRFIDSLDGTYLSPALLDACSLVQSSAVAHAPHDTGNLQRSIEISMEDLQGVVYTNTEYAPYVEIGTGIHSSKGTGRKTPWRYKGAHGWVTTDGNPPQPFMQPALDECQQKILDLFKGLI